MLFQKEGEPGAIADTGVEWNWEREHIGEERWNEDKKHLNKYQLINNIHYINYS